MNIIKQSLEKQEKQFCRSAELAKELEKNCREKISLEKLSSYTPLPLQREIPPSRPYPFDALGEVPGKAARRIHEVVQAPDAICGQSILAALSVACQAFVNVKVDGREYPASLFILTISESGERKSAVDKIALKPIFDWQKMLVNQHKKQRTEFKIKYEVWKRRKDEILKTASDPNTEIVLKNMEQEPQPPCEGLILCEEPTLEGLEQLLEHGQPSIGVFSDEGGRFIGGHAMNSDNALKTACGLSNLWDGKPVTRVRKGDGNKIYFGRRVAMHLMIQPVILLQLMKNSLLVGQGLLSRCLFSSPNPLAGSRKYKEVDLLQDPSVIAYYDLLNKIIDRPYPKIQNDQNSDTPFGPGDALNPKPILLHPEAKKRWMEFHDNLDIGMSEQGDLYPIKSYASKAAEQVLRIAVIFAFTEHLLKSEEILQIDLQQINRAITLVEYSLSEVLRILGFTENNQDIELASKTLDWIKHLYPDQTFSLNEVYQKGPKLIRCAQKAREIMRILKEHDYVIEMENIEINGKRVRSAWRLNK